MTGKRGDSMAVSLPADLVASPAHASLKARFSLL
jgi:hypothetical protein